MWMKMAGTSTNTTPTFCEDTPGIGSDDSPLTSTKLMFSDDSIRHDDDDFVDSPTTELTSPQTAASTPSTSRKNATTDDGGNRNSLISMVTNASGDDIEEEEEEEEEEEPDLIRMLFGCIFTYAILGVWIWSIFALFGVIERNDCVAVYARELEGEASSTARCVEKFYGKLGVTHTITFGLISAVVISETDPKNESAMQRLRAITRPISNRRKAKKAHILETGVCVASLLIPAVYVISWSVGGIVCLIASISKPDGSCGPLFYTGEAFLGITIKQSYQFFGVENPAHTGGAKKYYDEEAGLTTSSRRSTSSMRAH